MTPVPWIARELARQCGGELIGDPERTFIDVAEIDRATSQHLTVVLEERLRAYLPTTRAGIVVTYPEWRIDRTDITWIVHAEPLRVLYVLEQWFGFIRLARAGVHATAHVDPSARVDPTAWIGPMCWIGPGAEIRARVWIEGHCVIYGPCVIDADTRIHAGVVVYPRVTIGRRVIIHAGAVIGADGFRFMPHPERPTRIPQLGRVVIEDDVEIGANTCIDRAFLGETRIGAGTKIDNLVQIAHNVRIGRACLIAGQAGIAGSTRVGDRVMMGGQAGVADHAVVGDDARIAAKAGVMRKVAPGQTVGGIPAMEYGRWLRIFAILKDLPRWVRKEERR